MSKLNNPHLNSIEVNLMLQCQYLYKIHGHESSSSAMCNLLNYPAYEAV